MARTHKVLSLAASLLLFTGCVSQEKYNALKLDRDGLAEQLAKSQGDVSGARAEADSYKNQLNQFMNGMGGKDALVGNLQQQVANLNSQLDEINRKYADAIGRGGGQALPPVLNDALQQFANQNPDLVDFDSARGIVKFKSDVTFASGDATLTAKAKEAINRFASILNSQAASGYELMVAGHTDNTRVVNQHTIAAGHKDNWYLSAHRAISVGDALIGQQVNPQRVAVVGYADQRPVASNSSPTGQAQNRRVEVLILPTQVRGNAVAGASHTTTKKPAPSANKDSTAGGPEMGRPLNK